MGKTYKLKSKYPKKGKRIKDIGGYTDTDDVRYNRIINNNRQSKNSK